MFFTSFSLMQRSIDLENETKLDREVKYWLALATQKFIEVDSFLKALIDKKDEAFPLFLYLEFRVKSLS